MSEAELHFSVLESRSALVRAIQLLRHSPEERIAAFFKALYGPEMKSACAKIHASVYAEMFEVLLNDFDERYRQQLLNLQAQMDCAEATPASTRGSEHMQESRP